MLKYICKALYLDNFFKLISATKMCLGSLQKYVTTQSMSIIIQKKYSQFLEWSSLKHNRAIWPRLIRMSLAVGGRDEADGKHHVEIIVEHFLQKSNLFNQRLIIDRVASVTSGQSYKHFMLVNYNSGVVIWGIFQSGTTLES